MPDTDLSKINHLAGLGMGAARIRELVKRASGQPYTYAGITQAMAKLRKQKSDAVVERR